MHKKNIDTIFINKFSFLKIYQICVFNFNIEAKNSKLINTDYSIVNKPIKW